MLFRRLLHCADRNQRDEHCKRSDQPSAEDTKVLYFQRPAGFQFRTGQYIDVTLLDPLQRDARSNNRTFLLADSMR
jgi:ferredoxin-NADP reductase